MTPTTLDPMILAALAAPPALSLALLALAALTLAPVAGALGVLIVFGVVWGPPVDSRQPCDQGPRS